MRGAARTFGAAVVRVCAAAAAAALVLAACFALAVCAPSQAHAAAQPEEDPVVNLTVPSHINVDRIGFLELPAQTDPASIEVGIPCGMLDMCGQDPCLCGAVDDYGACACNGKEWVTPDFAVDFAEEGVAATVEAFGKTYLVPLSAGQVDVVVTASLPHHRPSSVHATVFVDGFTVFDLLKIVAVLAVVAAVCAGLFFGVRAVARLVRRLGGRRRSRRAEKEQQAAREATELADAPAKERILRGSSILKDGGGKGSGRSK